VRFYVETLASIAERYEQLQQEKRPVWKFSWRSDDAMLVMYDSLRDEESVLVHDGLGLDLDVSSMGLDRAIKKAQNLAEGLVNLLAYVTATACKPAIMKSCHRIPEHAADVETVWVHQRTRVPLGDLKPIRPELLGEAYRLYDKADEEAKWRISQTAQWFRKGLLELDTVSQFIAYWVGLESAAGGLQDALTFEEEELRPTCSRCKHQITSCPECGASMGRPNRMAGVAELFNRFLDDGRKTYGRVRSLRGQLFHGGKKPKPEFIEALQEAVPAVREALGTAIGVLLGMEEGTLKEIAKGKPRRASRPIRVKVLGELVGFKAPPLERPDLQPYVEHDPEEVYTISPEGKLNIAFKHNLTMRNGSFRATGYEMRGDEYAKAKD